MIPYLTGTWPQHTWGTAIGDYMFTSQSAYDNVDGSTTFFYYSSGNPLSCDFLEANHYPDGNVGRRNFYEARGYATTDCYNRLIDPYVSGGFTLADYQAEIDAGHPVMIGLNGHTGCRVWV